MGYKVCLAMVVVVALVHGLHGCDSMTLLQCGKNFLESGFLRLATGTFDIYQICSEYDTLKSCVRDSANGCDIMTPVVSDIITAAFDFMCSENGKRETALIEDDTSEDCLDTIVAANRLCLKRFKKNAVDDPDNMCWSIETYAKCVLGAMRFDCKILVINWYARLLDAVLEPSNKLAGCRLFSAQILQFTDLNCLTDGAEANKLCVRAYQTFAGSDDNVCPLMATYLRCKLAVHKKWCRIGASSWLADAIVASHQSLLDRAKCNIRTMDEESEATGTSSFNSGSETTGRNEL